MEAARICAGALLVSVLALLPAVAPAVDFRLGPVEGLLDIELAYGLAARTETRDEHLIAIASGGKARSANFDDGTLNYDTGVVSNMFKGTTDLAVRWRRFGGFVRAFGFYDIGNEDGSRERTRLSSAARDHVGSDVDILDAYVTARFEPAAMPLQLRVGRQIVSWGQSSFVQNGINIANALDVPAFQQPVSRLRDLFRPQGMLWGALGITEILSVEAFYQYEWKRTIAAPTGSYFGTSDIVPAGGRFATGGFGQVSDLGTNLDRLFDLPEGTLGFDPNYLHIPRGQDRTANDQGQFGLALQLISPRLNDSTLTLHFMNYHSRLPVLNGTTGDAAAVAATSPAAVADRAAALEPIYLAEGLAPGEASARAEATARSLALNDYARQTDYFLKYPENIQMLGFSFATATIRTGTLVSGEVSHHFDVPAQIDDTELVFASLSPVQFTSAFENNQIGSFGPDEIIKGFIERDKTQTVFGLTQLLGPRLRANQVAIGTELGWVHFHDLPGKSRLRLEGPGTTTSGNTAQAEPGGGHAGLPAEDSSHFADTDSLGYWIFASMTYANVFGGINVRPGIVWKHDVEGVTPVPGGQFVEGRKAITFSLEADYLSTFQINLSYTNLFGAGRYNLLNDRDVLGFSVRAAF